MLWPSLELWRLPPASKRYLYAASHRDVALISKNNVELLVVVFGWTRFSFTVGFSNELAVLCPRTQPAQLLQEFYFRQGVIVAKRFKNYFLHVGSCGLIIPLIFRVDQVQDFGGDILRWTAGFWDIDDWPGKLVMLQKLLYALLLIFWYRSFRANLEL